MERDLKPFEIAVQRSIDAVLASDSSTEVAKLMARSHAFAAMSPSLSVWLNRVLIFGGHENEKLIGLRDWMDADIAVGLCACLALRRQAPEPATRTMSEALLELFATATGNRLLQRAVDRLTGDAA